MVNPPRKIMGGLGNRLFQFAYIYAQYRKGTIPDIYVQDFEYFKDYKEEIRKIYQEGIGEPKDAVAVHIRRGDYVNNPFYVDLTKTDYYELAFQHFKGKKFIIFYGGSIENDGGKDKEWVHNWMKRHDIDYEIRDGQDEVEALNEMASCKGMILANSSFSIWAGFLNINKDKKIIAPKDYYTDKVQRTKYSDEGWLLI